MSIGRKYCSVETYRNTLILLVPFILLLQSHRLWGWGVDIPLHSSILTLYPPEDGNPSQHSYRLRSQRQPFIRLQVYARTPNYHHSYYCRDKSIFQPIHLTRKPAFLCNTNISPEDAIAPCGYAL